MPLQFKIFNKHVCCQLNTTHLYIHYFLHQDGILEFLPESSLEILITNQSPLMTIHIAWNKNK